MDRGAAKKTIYFVRHGESEVNASPVLNGIRDSKLTEKGRGQAAFLGKRLLKLRIDTVLSSTLPRARQTAEIINTILQKPIEFSDLIVEIRVPSELEGKARDSAQVKHILAELAAHWNDLAWRYSDEENFLDRKARGARIIKYLTAHSAERLLVVSHGSIIRTVVASLLFGDGMTSQEHDKFWNFMDVKNTGVTICKLLPDDRWKLSTWNDLAHLE